MKTKKAAYTGRRNFLKMAGIGAMVFGMPQLGCSSGKKVAGSVIQGFDDVQEKKASATEWIPVSDRKIKIGIAGYGVCKFGAAFSFQNHPNVEIVAVSDLFPDRCSALAEQCRCNKTYPSLEEMIKDPSIEAVFLATDAPSHARQAVDVLRHGKHVASAVPAVFESLDEADLLIEEVKKSGLKYMMFETSCYRNDNYAMRQIYNAGGFGKIIYSEGEYFHYGVESIDSYKGWRIGLPPQWYPTHSNAYYIGITSGSFTEVSCMGIPSIQERYQKGNNRYKNPFGTEIALFRTSEGGMARMAVSWDTPGEGDERGRVRGEKGCMGSFYGEYKGLEKNLPPLEKPALPPGVEPGGHGGSHGYLTHEFVMSIIEERKPLVDVAMALNLTVAGIVAHKSALKNGELLKIPQYSL